MRRYLMALGIASLLISGISCSSNQPTEPGNGGEGGGGGSGSGSGAFSVEAYVSTGFSAVKLRDSLGNPITTATVVINGDTLSLYGTTYYSNTVSYTSGETYNLSIDAGDYGTASATVTAPNIDGVNITSPDSGQVFQTGSPIDVSWVYQGGDNSDGKAGLTLYYDSRDTLTYYSGILNGTTTSHTIPAGATSLEGDAHISIMAGNLTTISGLLDPDPYDGLDGSFFIVYVFDYVDIYIGDTSGGGGTPTDVSGDWGGRWQSLMNANPGCNGDTLIITIPSVAGDGSFNAGINGGCAGNMSASGTALDYTLQMTTSTPYGTLYYDGIINSAIDSIGGTWRVIYNSTVVDSGYWWVRKP